MNRLLLPILTIQVLLALGGALLAAACGGAGSAAAQEPTPAITSLTGQVSTIVDRTIVDGVVVDQTEVPVTHGHITIIELDATQPLAADGTFNFPNLLLPEEPMLVSIEIRAVGYRPTTWANYLLMFGGTGPNFTPNLEPGGKPKVIDLCPELLVTPRDELSAVTGLMAKLCAELPKADLPAAGSGSSPSESFPFGISVLIACLGAVLITVGAFWRSVHP